MEINTFRELKELYNDEEEESWLLLSTGGFSGTQLTLDDVESILVGESPLTDPINGKYWITILLIYPKKYEAGTLEIRYGDVSIDQGDVQWLREAVRESLLAIKDSQEGNV